MSWTKWIVLIFAANLIIFSGSDKTTPTAPSEEKIPTSTKAISTERTPESVTVQNSEVKVTRVIDGDTIEISGGQKVRYIGIDTPEGGGCFARESKLANENLVLGKTVRLERDVSETDRYGRLLRYIWVENTLVNETLVRQGFAKSYAYPPDTLHQNRFDQAEASAQVEKRGLWSACVDLAKSNNSTSVDSGCLIKGNIGTGGEKIYHLPWQSFYDRTVIDEGKGERYFCSESEAQTAGWRKSKR